LLNEKKIKIDFVFIPLFCTVPWRKESSIVSTGYIAHNVARKSLLKVFEKRNP